nr:MAG TPA: hypothetical protein [Caudoviricetes sp.]
MLCKVIQICITLQFSIFYIGYSFATINNSASRKQNFLAL